MLAIILLSLTGVSTAKDMSEETQDDIEVEAQDGAKAFLTLLFGKTFSFPSAKLPAFLLLIVL